MLGSRIFRIDIYRENSLTSSYKTQLIRKAEPTEKPILALTPTLKHKQGVYVYFFKHFTAVFRITIKLI